MEARVIGSESAGLGTVQKLYLSTFPEAERIPWAELMRLAVEMPLAISAYYDDAGELIGFTIVFERETYCWLWYFAVVPENRNEGYGSKILASLKRRYQGRRVIVDIESPAQPSGNAEQRRRRHAFYERNGFGDTSARRTFDGVTYQIMMAGDGTFTNRDYDAIISELRQYWKQDKGKKPEE